MVYEHIHLATKTYSKHTLRDNYNTNIHNSGSMHYYKSFNNSGFKEVKGLWSYWSKIMNVQPDIMMAFFEPLRKMEPLSSI